MTGGRGPPQAQIRCTRAVPGGLGSRVAWSTGHAGASTTSGRSASCTPPDAHVGVAPAKVAGINYIPNDSYRRASTRSLPSQYRVLPSTATGYARVDAATLPARAGQHRVHRGFDAGVRVSGDQDQGEQRRPAHGHRRRGSSRHGTGSTGRESQEFSTPIDAARGAFYAEHQSIPAMFSAFR